MTPTAFKQVKDNAKARVLTNELNNTDATISFDVDPGYGVLFSGFPGNPYYVTAWNDKVYPDPSDDPDMRVGTCTARSDDVLTVTWGAFGTPVEPIRGRPKIGQLFVAQHLNDVTAAINELQLHSQLKIMKTIGTVGTTADYICDGTADNVQIQAALDDVCLAGGGGVYQYPGQYNWAALAHPRSNVHYMGAGQGVTTNNAPTVSAITRMLYGDGTYLGEKYLNNFTLSHMTFDMKNKQTMGMEIRYFNNFHEYEVEWKNIQCITVGGASRWGNKFGTIDRVLGVDDVEGSMSTRLNLHDNYYHDNFTRTFETVLFTNTDGVQMHHNRFEHNSTLAPIYDEVSMFIYNQNVDYHDNMHLNSGLHGPGVKESNRVRIHDNLILHDRHIKDNYNGIRAWNTGDVGIYDNTIIGPETYDITGTITAVNEPVVLHPGAFNEVTILTTATIQLTGTFDDTVLYSGQPIYSAHLPEGCTILTIDTVNHIIKVNKTATGLVSETFTFGHNYTGCTHADRNIGYDLHSLRNPYTRRLSIRNNKFYSLYTGISSGAASLGIDVTAEITVSGAGRTVTLTRAQYTIEGVNFDDSTQTTKYLFVGEKLYGTGIPDDTSIVSIDSDTQVTVSADIPLGSITGVLFDTNTITYRHSDVKIEGNDFVDMLRNAVQWGNSTSADQDVQRFYVRNNTIGKWRGTGGGAIDLRGYTTDITKFKDLFVENNIIGPNIEGTNNCGIQLLGLTAARVKNNVIPTYGTLGRVRLANNAKITDLQDGFVTYTSAKTLAGEDNVFFDATSGNVVCALPDPAGYTGKEYYIMKIDNTANTVTVDPTGFNPINGIASALLAAQYQGIRVKSDGAFWYVIGSTAIGSQTLQNTYGAGNIINIADGSNRPLSIINSDVTNDPDTVLITNNANGNGLKIVAGALQNTSKYALFVDTAINQTGAPLVRFRSTHASSNKGIMALDYSGTGYALAIAAAQAITTNGDVEITDTTKGIILKAPDNSRWRVTVDNTGALVRTSI